MKAKFWKASAEMGEIEQRLDRLKLELPATPKANGMYEIYRTECGILHTSGQPRSVGGAERDVAIEYDSLLEQVESHDFWLSYLSDALQATSSVGIHLAIFAEPFLSMVLSGEKTVESRFSRNRCAPTAKSVTATSF